MTDDLDQIEEEAKTLKDAAAIFARLKEAADEMDGKAGQTEGQLAEAEKSCKELSMAMTITLMQHGRVPDFEEPDDEDDDTPSPTFQ